MTDAKPLLECLTDVEIYKFILTVSTMYLISVIFSQAIAPCNNAFIADFLISCFESKLIANCVDFLFFPIIWYIPQVIDGSWP